MSFDHRNTVVIALLSLLVLPVGVSVYLRNGPQATPLTLSLTGTVIDPLDQQYSMQGGKMVNGSILGHFVDVRSAMLNYSLDVRVSGLSSTGRTSLNLSAMTTDGKSVSVRASGLVESTIPAIQFPFGCTITINCTSEIPAAFLSFSNVSLSVGNYTSNITLPIAFESGYLNPFAVPW